MRCAPVKCLIFMLWGSMRPVCVSMPPQTWLGLLHGAKRVLERAQNLMGLDAVLSTDNRYHFYPMLLLASKLPTGYSTNLLSPPLPYQVHLARRALCRLPGTLRHFFTTSVLPANSTAGVPYAHLHSRALVSPTNIHQLLLSAHRLGKLPPRAAP